MILHLFLGDLYIEKFPSSLKYLKLVVKIDECREHGIASDLYLSDNIVRFNQTIHFPVNDNETLINEIELSLISIHADLAENLLGFAKFVCTSGEHSITKTVTLHDYRGVLVGKVPVTSFYYSSAIKLGDRVMFKPTYAPSAKEHAFLLNRRFREMHKGKNTGSSNKPVTFNDDIEHRLNNEVRDLMNHDFKIVSSNRVKKKPVVNSTSSSGVGMSAAKDSMTYNPGMTRNGAMSDAARGRVAPKMPIGGTKKSKSKPKTPNRAEPPKLRTTYMSVGYVKDKQWPERTTGATQRNLYRIQQASEMKLQILKDIALTVKQRNIRTQAKQEAIRQKKMQVEVDEGKLKRVLIRKENEIQLLKGTLTHLRLTSALQQDEAPQKRQRDKARHNSFSRLSHLTYPNPNDSSFRRSGTPISVRRASTPGPASALRSSSAGPQRRQSGTPTGRVRRNSTGQNVSFFADLSRHATPAPVLYHPMSDRKSPYDSRVRRSASTSGYSAKSSQEELVDQLSDIFDTDFQEDRTNHLHPVAAGASTHDHDSQAPVLQSTYGRVGNDSSRNSSVGRHIAKDWLANARASINEYHRPASGKSSVSINSRSPPLRTASPQGTNSSRPGGHAQVAPGRPRGAAPASRPASTSSAAVMKVHRSQPPSQPASAPKLHAGEEALEAQDVDSVSPREVVSNNGHFEHFHDTDSASKDERRRHQQNQNTVAMPSFLNALVDNQDATRNAHAAEMDTTVSSIAVGDIPWMPPQVPASKVALPAADASMAMGTTGTTASTAAAASWRDVYNTNSVPTVVVPGVSKSKDPQVHEANNTIEAVSPDHSLHSSDSLEDLSQAQKPQSTINYAAASSATNSMVPSGKPRPMSAGAAARLQRNQQYTLQSTMSASDRTLTGTFPAREDQRDQVKGLMTSHRRAGEPLQAATEKMDDFAKSQFSIRFDGTDLRVPPLRYSSSSAAKQEIVARQLEKNRRYASASSTATATQEEEHVEAFVEAVPEEETEPTTDVLNTSLSEQLQRRIRNVYENVGNLENRVGTMKQQRKEDRVPQGWVRRSTATVTTTTTTTNKSTGTTAVSTSTSSNTRSVTAAARKSVPLPPAATSTNASATTSGVFTTTTTLDDSGSPAEEDLKILFEDASSESSDSRDFDLLRHKEAVAARA